ncbi:MAG: hypothetical protein HXX16_04005 [Bacteroidales bacterium]|nr:hypothetical protein [Bacteroidales bacterium]
MRTTKILCFTILTTVLLFAAKPALSQVEQLQNICSLYFSPEYISDGQEYFATLKSDQKAEFRTTFYGDNTYRIVACTNLKKGDLVFTVFDTEKNLLFTNANYKYSQYWDFKFCSTITCIIQVDVKNIKFIPGYVMLLIGYKP